jgi:nitrite reductase/ring-hydroxylating ferredoxin subunit
MVANTWEVRAERPFITRIGVKKIALFRIGDDIFAINDACPHAGGSLGLGDVKGTLVTCRRHNWAFDVTSGLCPGHDIYRVRTYEVEIRGKEVFVGIPDEY